jgi:single-strand DNA-binding protein
MANSINRAIIVGRVGKDPEIKSFSNGGKIANFSIATSQSWKDRQTGEKKEATEWHLISIQSEGLVGIVEKYVNKGDMIGVEGELRTRSWDDQNGNKRYSTEIVVTAFGGQLHMLGSKKDGDRQDSGSSGRNQTQTSNSGGGYTSDYDQEIPF